MSTVVIRRTRSLIAVSIAAVATLALSACGTPVPDSTDTDSSADPSPDWPAIAVTPPSGIPNLQTTTIADQDDRMHIVVPQLNGHDALNTEMTDWATATETTFRNDYLGDDGDSTLPWLSGTWQTTGIAKDAIGFVLETTMSPGASVGTAQRTVWYDPSQGELVASRDLLGGDDVVDAVIAAAQKSLESAEVDIDADAVHDAIAKGGPAIGFTSTGSLFIGFDSYEIAAGAAGTPSVALETPVENGWLSDFGVRAREATLSPTPAEIPDVPPIPTPPSVDCSAVSCVALTFDDGPSGATTPRLLDMLADADVPATFFMLGSQAQAFPNIVSDIAAAGHELGNHTWSHPDLTGLSPAEINAQLTDTNETIAEITGITPKVMRPPYGAKNDAVAQAAKDAGLAEILWNVDTRDWEHHSPAKTVAEASQAAPGSIILMHDIHSTTVDAVPDVISALKSKGFTFVTVSTLLGNPEPGSTHFSRSG